MVVSVVVQVAAPVKEIHQEDTGPWDVDSDFNLSAAQEFAIMVTGAAGSTIRWEAKVDYTKSKG